MDKVILKYHDIVPNGDISTGMSMVASDTYKIDRDKFEEQVCAIRHYLDENNISSDKVVFTFDDGGITFSTEAAPILEKHNFIGMFFISTSFIGKKGFLNPEQIKSLSDKGHIIGSHSHWHDSEVIKKNIKTNIEDWKKSVNILSSITGKPIKVASLPRGDGPTFLKKIIFDLGITELYTSVPTTKVKSFSSNRKEIGRYVIHRNLPLSNVLKIVQSSFYRNKMLLKWCFITIIKRILGDSYMSFKSLILRYK